ncbi:MAG: efflux RND transporter periplasmic adaptor subunit [Burkholderiaceae bacterium]
MNVRATGTMIAAVLACAGGDLRAGQFDCLIEPRQTIEIRPWTEGLITRVNVQRGDTVRAGQVLVELDSGLERATAASAKFRSEMQGAVKSRESRIDFLSQKAIRRDKLAKENFISIQDRDEAAAELRLAETELTAAREDRAMAALEYKRTMEQLRLRSILSPIDGIVTDRLMNPGELADNRDVRKPVLRLAETKVLHVEVLLPNHGHKSVKLGQTIVVVPEQPAGVRYQATVKVIDQVLDAASGSFGVRLELANPRAEIPAGVKCRATFDAVAEAGPRRSLGPAPDLLK